VPGAFSVPIRRYQAAPLAMMPGYCRVFRRADECSPAKHAIGGRVGRAQPWLTALALQAFDQSCFLTADIGACAAMEVDMKVESHTHNIVTQVTGSLRVADGLREQRRWAMVLARM